MLTNLSAVKISSLGDQVYLSLSQALINGEMAPGEPLRIRAVATRLGTSVTPVRDAVLRLVHEEALVMRNARDVRVPVLTAEQFLEIRSIRNELEGLAAEQAAAFAKPDDIARLQATIRDAEKAIRAGDETSSAALNSLFHTQIVEIARAPVLLRVLQRLWIRIGPLVAHACQVDKRVIIRHHHEIVAAIKAHDGQQARIAMRCDIIEGGSVVLDAMKHDKLPVSRRSTMASRKVAEAGAKTSGRRKQRR